MRFFMILFMFLLIFSSITLAYCPGYEGNINANVTITESGFHQIGLKSYTDFGNRINSNLSKNEIFSISLWFKEDISPTLNFLFSSTISSTDRMSIAFYNSYLRVALYTGSWKSDYVLWNNDTSSFHHVVMTYDGDVVLGYLDGVPFGNPGNSASSTSATVRTALGARTDFASVNYGYIDHLTIYNSVLTPDDVYAIYSSGMTYPPIYDNLFIHYSSNSYNGTIESPDWIFDESCYMIPPICANISDFTILSGNEYSWLVTCQDNAYIQNYSISCTGHSYLNDSIYSPEYIYTDTFNFTASSSRWNNCEIEVCDNSSNCASYTQHIRIYVPPVYDIGERWTDGGCPLEESQSYIIGLFLIFTLLLTGIYLNIRYFKFPFYYALTGIAIIIMSLPFYRCGTIIGIGVSLLGLLFIFFEISEWS